MNKIKNGFSLYDMKKKMNDEINELISKKSCINKDICNNIDLNARYLVIFNEVHKHIFCNSDAKVSPFKQKLRNILWEFKFWRTIVMFLKKKK